MEEGAAVVIDHLEAVGQEEILGTLVRKQRTTTVRRENQRVQTKREVTRSQKSRNRQTRGQTTNAKTPILEEMNERTVSKTVRKKVKRTSA